MLSAYPSLSPTPLTHSWCSLLCGIVCGSSAPWRIIHIPFSCEYLNCHLSCPQWMCQLYIQWLSFFLIVLLIIHKCGFGAISFVTMKSVPDQWPVMLKGTILAPKFSWCSSCLQPNLHCIVVPQWAQDCLGSQMALWRILERQDGCLCSLHLSCFCCLWLLGSIGDSIMCI